MTDVVIVVVPLLVIAAAVVLGRRFVHAHAESRASGFDGGSHPLSGELFAYATPRARSTLSPLQRAVGIVRLIALIAFCGALIAAMLWGIGHVLNQEMARYVHGH